MNSPTLGHSRAIRALRNSADEIIDSFGHRFVQSENRLFDKVNRKKKKAIQSAC